MLQKMVVAARDVRLDDRVFNSLAYDPAAAWWCVTEIERINDSMIAIRTHVFEEWKHPLEAVFIQREVL